MRTRLKPVSSATTPRFERKHALLAHTRPTLFIPQAEHDPSALPALICFSSEFVGEVDAEIASQLARLSTKETAALALKNGYAVR